MPITLGASKIPSVVFEYWSLTHHDLPPGLYGMDKRRADCHEELCKEYGITKEQSRKITDHLNKCADAYDLHLTLKMISNGAL